MPRLNVYIPTEIQAAAKKWRGKINLSEICVRALREELEAAESGRESVTVGRVLNVSTRVERTYARQLGLTDVRIGAVPQGEPQYGFIGETAASYLDQVMTDEALVAVGGGRQMWYVVRNMMPRNLRATFTALGINQADPVVLHAHPNTLTTLLWLLYTPRGRAHLVGSPVASTLWQGALKEVESNHVRFVVVASCGPIAPDSPLTKLLDDTDARALQRQNVAMDFAYNFMRKNGDIVDFAPSVPHTILKRDFLQAFSRRSDSRVVLVAAGRLKVPVIRNAIQNRLCNTLITDGETIGRLLS